MRLVGRALVRVAGRHRDAVDAERADAVEEARDALRIGVVEQRAVDVDAEARVPSPPGSPPPRGRTRRSSHTERSCISRSPSRCTDQTKYGLGSNSESRFFISSALVQR